MDIISEWHILLQLTDVSTRWGMDLSRSYCLISPLSIFAAQCISVILGEMNNIVLCVLIFFQRLGELESTFSKMACDVGEWQVPCWKLPQVPEGVPKLANLMEDMDCPGPQ